jgi:hypothetical protein
MGHGRDDPLERRRGTQSRAHGLDRDPVCSFHSDGVNASGWRWLSLMRLGPRPWAKRVGAVPFVTVLAPAERSHRDRGQQPTKQAAWARPRLLVVRRGVPARPLVLGTTRRGAVITWRWRLSRVAPPLSSLTRVRLDAALYDPARPRKPRQTGRPRVQGQRLPTVAEVLANPATGGHTATGRGWQGAGARVGARVSATAVWSHAGRPPLPICGVRRRDPPGPFAPQALRWTDLTAEPAPILEWFVRRWRLEVTWQEAHAHLGLETPRHGHAWAIARTTPALRGRFSRLTR